MSLPLRRYLNKFGLWSDGLHVIAGTSRGIGVYILLQAVMVVTFLYDRKKYEKAPLVII